MLLESVSLWNSWLTASKGKERIAEWKILLDDSSVSTVRIFIFFLSSNTGRRSGFGAWQCSVDPQRMVSISRFDLIENKH